jgi:hypothetical protein
MNEGIPQQRRNSENLEEDFSSEGIRTRLREHYDREIIEQALNKVNLSLEDQVLSWNLREDDRKKIAEYLSSINASRETGDIAGIWEIAKQLAEFLNSDELELG